MNFKLTQRAKGLVAMVFALAFPVHDAWSQALTTTASAPVLVPVPVPVPALQTTETTQPALIPSVPPTVAATAVAKPWHVTLRASDKFPIQGMLDYGKLGSGGGSVMYPGGHPAVFLGALLVHGIMNSVAQSERESAQQNKANEVLQPFSKAIAAAKIESMLAQSINAEGLQARLLLSPHAPNSGPRILSSPEFFLHPDLRGLVLAHRIELYDGASDKPSVTTVIRLSTHFPRSSVVAQQWRDDEGAGLLNASHDLLKRSLRILDRSLLVDAVLQPKEEATVKHDYLGERRIERAQVLIAQCNRALLKNLRGELMGVQLWTDAPQANETPIAENTQTACSTWF